MRNEFSIAVLFCLLLTACDSPTWRNDRYHVIVDFAGTTCVATLDGRPIPGGWDRGVWTDTSDTGSEGMPAGEREMGFGCTGVAVGIVAKKGEFPANQVYRIENTDGPPKHGNAAVLLRTRGLPRGIWPAALLMDVDMRGAEGTLRIERISKKYVVGRLDVIMHRALSQF
jgi:hypothetical protein